MSKILIIYTGGTIGMVRDSKTFALVPFDFEQIQKELPELKKIDAQLTTVSLEKPIDSSNITPDIWLKIAEIIEINYELFDGFVVLHGTDTIAYSASALSFIIKNLSKPVVFTGSQLPISEIRTDGKENIINAIEIAAMKEKNKALIPEVSICFQNFLYRANRTTKFSTQDFDAFTSTNYPYLAKVGTNINVFPKNILYPKKNEKLSFAKKLNNNIAIISLFPGISLNLIDSILKTKNIEAVILQTYGSGNAPESRWFINKLKMAIEQGIIILNISQCKEGFVKMGKYKTSERLAEIGIIGGNDITPEAAITKLMYLLAKYSNKNKVKELLLKSIRGEQSN